MAFDITSAKPVSGFDISSAKPVDEGAPEEQDGFSFSEMASNVPSSAANLASGIYQTVTHPVESAKGIGRTIGGLAQKAEDYDQPAGPLTVLAKALDYLGVDYRNQGDAVLSAIDDRYGSVDNALNTLEKDPVGAMADLSAVVAPFSPKMSAAINPVNAATNTAKVVAGKVIPKALPKKMYESVAKFSTTIPEKQRAAMVDTALKHEIMPTSKGVSKLEGLIDGLNTQIDDLISNAGGKTIPAKAVYKHLKELRQKKGGMSLDAPDDIRAINRVVSNFEKHLKDKGKSRLTPAELQELKVNTYKSINWDAKRLTGTPIKEDTYKAIARGSKEGIEQMVPEVKGVNKSLGELYELQPHLQRAASRIENKNIISLQDAPQVLAGTVAAGPTGAWLGAIVSFLGKDRIKGVNAIRLQRLVNNANFQQYLRNNPNISKGELMAIIAGRQELPIRDDQL